MKKCNIKSCNEKHHGKGYCRSHYNNLKRNGDPLVQHQINKGYTRKSSYSSWYNMKTRCLNANSPRYKDYGGRGISVCEEWLSFKGFYKDMGDRPKGMSLERIDVNGNYESSNCKWADNFEQGRNRRVQKNNTSGFTGVSLYKNTGKWVCSIRINGKRKHIGYFATKEEAAYAYKKASKELL